MFAEYSPSDDTCPEWTCTDIANRSCSVYTVPSGPQAEKIVGSLLNDSISRELSIQEKYEKHCSVICWEFSINLATGNNLQVSLHELS